MADLRGFNAQEVDPLPGFDPLPAGRYWGVLTESVEKPNKSGQGSHLALTFEVLDGEFKGRKLWARFTLNHPNPTVVAIARAQLSSLCRAANVLQPRDSVELHNIPVVLVVKCRHRSDVDELENVIVKFEKKEPAKPPVPAANANTPPWKRSA